MNSKKIEKSNQSSLKNPIYRAVMKSDYNKLSILLNKASFGKINDKRLSTQALDLAALRGDSKAVELLLNHGAIPDYNRTEYTWSQSTLGRAIQSKKRKVIRLLINQGCDMDAPLKCESRKWSLCDLPYNHWSKVIQLDYFSIFLFIIKCSGRKISDDDWSRTLLLTACHTGTSRIAHYLIDQGVPIDSRGSNGNTGAFYALTSGHVYAFAWLVYRGANINITNHLGVSLLHIAVGIDYEVVCALLQRGLEVNLRDKRNKTPLHYAVLSLWGIAKILIDRGANINAIDDDGRTPFHIVYSRKTINYGMVRLLMRQKNIDLGISDNKGVTILHHMAANNVSVLFPNIENTLYRPEVDIDARDQDNRTPLEYLLASNRFSNLGQFLDLGADTEVLHSYYGRKSRRNLFYAITPLIERQIKLSTARLDRDANIDAVIENSAISMSPVKRKKYHLACSKEIGKMKKTVLVDRLTYYDFLHAKRRTCMAVAKGPNMHEKFDWRNHRFIHYSDMLFRKYRWGLKPFTKLESEAITNVDENLNFIFNRCLPSLIIEKIKNYINIEDTVALQYCINAYT